jgi:hypothetical protein
MTWRKAFIDQLVGPRKATPVDLAAVNAAHADHDTSQPSDPEALRVAVPPDLPMYLSLHRLTQKTKDDNTADGGHRASNAYVGSTLTLDAFTFGVKVYVRHGRADGTLRIYIEDTDGRELIAEYQEQDT